MAKRRIRTKLSIFFIMAGLVAGGQILGKTSSEALETYTFAQDWVFSGKHAGFYAALDLGYYKEAGLDIKIERGYGSGDTVTKVGAGVAEFGFADAGSMVVGRSKGAKVKQIGMIHHKPLYVIYALKGSGITKPKDLEGRSIGSPEGNATRVIFPAFAAFNKVDINKVTWVTMTGEAELPSLLAGRVDATADFTIWDPTYKKGVEKVGKELVKIMYSDWGIDIYSNGLITTDRMISDKPDAVRRFVGATMKGVARGVEHPEEAVDVFMKYNKALSRELAAAQWVILVDHLITPETMKTGIGYMIPEKMERTRDIITQYMNLPVKVAVDELYTNQFVPKLIPKRPK